MRAAAASELSGICRLVLFGDAAVLRSQAGFLGLPFNYDVLDRSRLSDISSFPERAIIHVPAEKDGIEIGKGSRGSGKAAAENVIQCADACLAHELDAMVTAPLSKKHLKQAGYDFPGHTELLAHLSQTNVYAMAFLSEKLKVVLATVHQPLQLAIQSLSAERILKKIKVTLDEFPRLGLPCRKMAVAGLNPHAGEEGILGTEEREIIKPAIQKARRLFPEVAIAGPLPADTIFYRAAQGEFDVVLALYHDQGLAPMKLLGFGEAVNVTLGLPFIRTSVDHGTAFDIAGQGIAKPDGMINAIKWAHRLHREPK